MEELEFEELVNPPATDLELSAAELELGVSIPEKIREVYRRYNGIPEYKTKVLPFHLLPLSEALEINRNFRDGGHYSEIIKRYSLVCFWGDDESNYAAVFVDGPLQGRVSFLDHDGYYVGIYLQFFGM